MDQDRHAERPVPGAREEVAPPSGEGEARSEGLRLAGLQASLGRPGRWRRLQASLGRPGRWRRFWGELVLGLPLLIALMSSFPHRRAPLPGESFNPTDLDLGWWALLKFVVLWGVPAAMVLWWMASHWRGGGLRTQAADIAVDQQTLQLVFDDHSVPIALDRIENVYRDGAPVLELVHANPGPPPAPRVVADHPAGAPLIVELRGGDQLMVQGEPDKLLQLQRMLAPAPQRGVARFAVGSAVSAFPVTRALAWLAFLWSYVACLAALAGVGEALVNGVAPRTPLLLVGLICCALVATMWPQLRRRRLAVGIDGVRIDGLWRHRFLGHDEISEVEETDQGVRLHRKKGRVLNIPAQLGRGRLAPAIVAARQARELLVAAQLEGLDRGTREVATWRRDMEALHDDQGYRKRAVRIEQLEDVLRDPTAPPERRVGAALALRSDASQRRRIRVAAEASADVDLRAVLEAAADGQVAETELERAQRRFERR